MIYNNYPDDYIVINAKWVEWDNDEQMELLVLLEL